MIDADAWQEANWEQLAMQRRTYNHGWKCVPLPTPHPCLHRRARQLHHAHVRSERRRYAPSTQLAHIAAPLPDLHPVTYVVLERTLARCPRRDQIIWFATFMGYLWGEIAAKLNVTTERIRGALHRVNLQLKKVFQP